MILIIFFILIGYIKFLFGKYKNSVIFLFFKNDIFKESEIIFLLLY